MDTLQPTRWARAALCVAVGVHILFLISLPTGFLDFLFVEAVRGHGQASDFFGIYQAGANLLDGYSIYDSPAYLHEAPQVVPFYYFYRYLPPTAYAAALCAWLLAPWAAYWVWVLLNEIFIALVVISLLRWTRWPANRRWLTAALWLGFFPVYIEQIMGQFSLTMALLLWILWRYDREPATDAAQCDPHRHRGLSWVRSWKAYRWERDRIAPVGVLIAWAASITLKSFSVFLALPYLRDRLLKRNIAAAGITAALCVPYFAYHLSDLSEFIRLNLVHLTPKLYMGAFGFQTALKDLLTHLPTTWTCPSFSIAGYHLTVEKTILRGTILLVLALAAWATMRFHRTPQRRALDLALWTTAFFLIFKCVWEYHYIMMLPAITALYLVSGSRMILACGIWLGLPTLFAAAPVLTGVSSLAEVESWPAWFRILHFNVKTLPTLGIFGWCLHAAWNPQSHLSQRTRTGP
ncbi:MAG: DUF2029 domain-containing protein [Candidatus Eisenbacteria sp.]|nr:DUF2029 domain-containing protein [Candidatus Eisenbacteria bacterium]